MPLPRAVLDDVEQVCTIYYIDRWQAKWWSRHRKPGEPVVYCGHYWAGQGQEGGPFMTHSAAARDVWVRLVLGVAPPSTHAHTPLELAAMRKILRERRERQAARAAVVVPIRGRARLRA